MKIIGGKFKGRNFYTLQGIRPTLNMSREAVFDLIGHDLKGMVFLDLFAGSGAVGLEALSRGAKQVVFVEKNLRCAQIINENLNLLTASQSNSEGASFEVLPADTFVVIKRMQQLGKKFDCIFIDPPYGRGLAKKALKTLEAYDILHPNSLVIIEHSKREILPQASGIFNEKIERKYGKSYLTIYKAVHNTW